MASGETAGRLFRPAFAALCETHGVKLAVLFGSLVTGRASRSSDIDLGVLLDTKNMVGAAGSDGRHLGFSQASCTLSVHQTLTSSS
ncbi:MAG TPA: hypothetical protein DEQ28_04335 [Clostridiales bacterium]|nr:hypothetical protein [Clostridiales bacterium]